MTSELARARRIANELRGLWPEKAAEIDRLVAEAEAGQRDGVRINVGIRYRLEKFDGDPQPGQAPVAVIEGHDQF